MQDAHAFLTNLATVLGVAAITTVLFQRLKQPVVLGYILAGLIVGPHVPLPLIADVQAIHALSETGVILLMFSLGLEFTLGKLARVGPTAGLVAAVEVGIMLSTGYAAGRAFGWSPLESAFTGAVVAISSTTIIAKAFQEQNVTGKLRDLVFGILIVEDIVAILLLAVLTTLASGAGLSAGALAMTAGRLAAFLALLLAGGLLLVPRAFRAIVKLGRPETTLVASIGLCFSLALLAHKAGYSVALGAFVAGSLVAESGESETIEHLVQPVRDMFAAVFFVSVGMLLDPAVLVRFWPAIAALTAVVVGGKVIGVSLGAFLAGNGARTSIQAGMSLAQIGEFSFILAGLGLSLKATGEFLYPIAVAVSALTTLFTPWLIRAGVPLAALVDRKLPRPLQTFASLYEAWVEELRSGPRKRGASAVMRRLLGLLTIDTVCLAGVVIGGSLTLDKAEALLASKTGLGESAGRAVVISAATLLATPFCVGIARCARRLGMEMAAEILPNVEQGKVDMAYAPRRALVVAMQLACVIAVSAPLVAVTQPFLPPLGGAVVVGLVIAVMAVVFWRSAANLEGHVRAGAMAIVEVLAKHSKGSEPASGGPDDPAAQIRKALPGLGEPAVVRLEAGAFALGKTLATLHVRGLTGATVLAISRATEGVSVPTGREVLEEGDVLALAGSREAIEAAREILLRPPVSPADPRHSMA
jgi:CPA2 family monovalent cation:H+ antiporter-2